MDPFLKSILEACACLKEPFFLLNSEGYCFYASPAFASLTGLSLPCKPDDTGLDVRTFWPEIEQCDLNSDTLSVDFTIADGEAYRVRLELNHINSGCLLVRVTGGLALGESAQGFHAQRLEVLGMLASGVAHDFNNVLTGIMGHSSFLRTILPANGPHLESLKAIDEGARKGSEMTQQILGFSRLESADKVLKIDMCDLTRRTSKFLRGAISPEFQIRCDVPENPLYVLGVEAKLAQIIANLMVNSRDALSSGGFIAISLAVENDRAKLHDIFGGSDLSSKSYLELLVKDNGCGIEPEIIERIFEPYFTTKKERGTGLGLSTVHSIVEMYGGCLRIKSRPGDGTTVHIWLPLTDQPDHATKDAGKDKSGEVEKGSEFILIVDDEAPVRSVLRLSLQHLGYRVETASGGQEALRKFREAQTGYDLVITDILMPDLSGDQLFAALREIQPDVRVLLMSGYSSGDVVTKALKEGACGFLQKPFVIEELASHVRECFKTAN